MNKEKTIAYYQSLKEEDLCSCEDCIRFYRNIRAAYPKLASYLKALGIDIEKPLDTMPVCPDGKGSFIYAGPQYVILGSPEDFKETEVNGVSLSIEDSHPDPGLDEEYFVIECSEIDLPLETERNDTDEE